MLRLVVGWAACCGAVVLAAPGLVSAGVAPDLERSAEWFEEATTLSGQTGLPCPSPPPIGPFMLPQPGARVAALESFQRDASEYRLRIESAARPCSSPPTPLPGASPPKPKPKPPKPPIGPFKLPTFHASPEEYRVLLEEFREGAELLRQDAEADHGRGALLPKDYREALRVYEEGLRLYREGMTAYEGQIKGRQP